MKNKPRTEDGGSAGATGYVLAGAAVISVCASGGVEPLWFAPAQLAIAVAATVLFWRSGLPRVSKGTATVLIVLALMPLVQLIPLPASWVALLSPQRVMLANSFDGALGFSRDTLALSVIPSATTAAFLRVVCYLLVFLMAMRIYQMRGEQPALAGVLIGLGIFEAAYGMVQYLTGWQYIFFYKKIWYTAEATGTYINRNHYAGLLEMVAPFIVAGMLFRARVHTTLKQGFWRGLMVSHDSSLSLRDALVFALVLVGLIFSLSRMGIMAALIGISVTAAVILHERKRSVLIVLALMFLLTGGYASWIGLTPVMERFEGLGAQTAVEQIRLEVWRDTLTLIRDFPLAGSGLGTYNWVSLGYQSILPSARYEHAHNDYLETAADLGLPAAIVIWAGLWVLLLLLVRKVPRLRGSKEKILAAGCAGSMSALLVHSLVDFNLQIPANALIFSWIAGTAAALTQKFPLQLADTSSPRTPGTPIVPGTLIRSGNEGQNARPTPGRVEIISGDHAPREDSQ